MENDFENEKLPRVFLMEINNDSDSSEEEDDNLPKDSGSIDHSASMMYTSAFDPYRFDLSDHDSDDELCEERDCDTEEDDNTKEVSETVRDEGNWCKCGQCALLNEEGSISYCCCDIDVAVDMKGNALCITDHSKFKTFILNKDALEMVTYGYNLKRYPDKKDEEKFNKLLRYTAYRSFLNMLEFHGLGKNNRYRLPACVIISIRDKYPSLKGVYVGFKEGAFATVTNNLQQF